MPIRAAHRQFYGKAWKLFRLELIARHGKTCADCGLDHELINGAHLDHNPKSTRRVALLCPRCHARHDTGHRIAIMRRNRATAAGQLWLMPEMEWAPFAEFEIPGPIFDRLAQLQLFR